METSGGDGERRRLRRKRPTDADMMQRWVLETVEEDGAGMTKQRPVARKAAQGAPLVDGASGDGKFSIT